MYENIILPIKKDQKGKTYAMAQITWICGFISIFLVSNVLCDRPPLARNKVYEPTWESLDARPLPEWYDDAKFGIFLHWGVYSVPSFGSEWFWINWKSNTSKYVEFMKKNYPPGFTYQNFAPQFTTEFFDPEQWADIFHDSGAKYIVLTSKHHEGYTLFPSKYSFSWNSVDVGPQRDLVGELAQAVRSKQGIHFGVYYSLYEWFNRMYLSDKNSSFKEQLFVDKKILPEMLELIHTYKPDVLWTDGDWEAKDSYWKSKEFLAWLYNESPVKDTIIVNDRWGSEIPCNHGGVYTCTDRYNPGVLQNHKWENCMTVDKVSWGYRRNTQLSDFLTMEDLVKELVTTVSCGGNLLMNVGPTKEGTIIPIFQERLSNMGKWLAINGEAIYKTKPWIHQNDTLNGNVWYTQSKDRGLQSNEVRKAGEEAIYAIALEWPQTNIIHLGDLTGKMDSVNTKVFLLGNEGESLKWTEDGTGVWISLPSKEQVKSQWGWALRINGTK